MQQKCLFVLSFLLFSLLFIQISFFQAYASQNMPYTPPFDLRIGKYTIHVSTTNLSMLVEYVPAIFNDSRVMDFIEEYKPIWFEDLGVINSSWGSENASVCFSLISFNISELYQLLIWLNSDTFVPFSKNYSVAYVKLIDNSNNSLFNITEALLVVLEFMDKNNYNYSWLTGFYLAPMNNSPCITIRFTDGFSKFYKIQLALNLTIINFEQKVWDEKENPTLIMLSLLIPRIMVLFAVLLIVIRLIKHHKIMKKVAKSNWK